MDAIPLISSLADGRNLSSLLFYSFLVLVVRHSLPTHSTSSVLCGLCLCSPAPLKVKSRGSAKWNNNNAVCLYSRDLLCSKWSESDEEGEAEVRRDANDAMLMAVTLMIFPWLPASNLFFYVGFVVAGPFAVQQNHFSHASRSTTERILYIPSMGFCLLIATGMEALMKRKTSRFIRSGSLIALSILLMSFSARTFVRNIDWSNEQRLYTSGIAINPPKGIIAL